MQLQDFIRDIPDFPKPGIQFKDITPLLSSPEAFQAVIDQLASHFSEHSIDAIAAAEARGFLFATPLALAMSKPFIPLRKPGKLPYSTHGYSYDLEYGSAELHMHIDAVKPGARVLLVDDLLATGGTMQASCKLIEKAGGHVAGCAFLIELDFLGGRKLLQPNEVFSILNFQ